jgi:hypothetical protein
MVNIKAEAKTRKKRKPMTDEQRARCLANLQKGRETSLRRRQAKKVGKEVKKPPPPNPVAPAVPVPPPPTPVEKPKPVEKTEPKPEPAPAAPVQATAPAPVVNEGPLTISTFGGGMLW